MATYVFSTVVSQVSSDARNISQKDKQPRKSSRSGGRKSKTTARIGTRRSRRTCPVTQKLRRQIPDSEPHETATTPPHYPRVLSNEKCFEPPNILRLGPTEGELVSGLTKPRHPSSASHGSTKQNCFVCTGPSLRGDPSRFHAIGKEKEFTTMLGLAKQPNER